MFDLLAHLRNLSPDTAINLLRLALELAKYKRDKFKDPRAPERAEKVLTEAERQDHKTLDVDEIGRRVADALGPEDAEIVQANLELVSLLAAPMPDVDAFDYWGQLTRLVEGLRIYAVQQRLFELRGANKPGMGRALILPRTGSRILPSETAINLAVAFERQSVRKAEGVAWLQEKPQGFPICLAVLVDFNEHGYGGYGAGSVASDACLFGITVGDQGRHWLGFERSSNCSAHFDRGGQYMLKAPDFAAICGAIKEDIQEHVADVHGNEKSVRPLFNAIDEFVRGISGAVFL